MNFSLRTLLLFMAGTAIFLASLLCAQPWLADLYYTLALLTIGLASLAAWQRRGKQRAFWIGFLALFTVYFCHTVWPPELRTAWNMLQDFGYGVVQPPSVIVTRLLNAFYQTLYDTSIPPVPVMSRGRRQPPYLQDYAAFLTIGHIGAAGLAGLIGGKVAQRLNRGREVASSQ